MIISKKSSWVSCLFALISLSIVLTSCDNATNASTQKQNRQAALHRVQTVSVENKAVALTQVVSGTLEAVTKIRLYNEESGRITQLPFHEGDFVKKGSLLIQLDNTFLKTDATIAKASKQQAKLDLSRLKKLLPKKISTEEEVARAQTALNLASAEEERQITRLQRSSIKAPIDGLITRRLYEPGDMLAPQSHIHTIIDPSSLRLKAHIAERWIPLVKNGQSVALFIDALGDRTFKANVVRIHPTINARTHKGIVEILLDQVADGVTVGQFVRADIVLTASDRLVIPAHTIHFEPEGAYVYRINKNDNSEIAEKVYFKQGQQFGALTEIYSGLSAGDKIVTRGYLGLRDGKKVTVANQPLKETK
ncbi:MAG: efflux RND transporter periplasmic adaptor subunit [Gammaproteobacteria bacterium]|nr:efflux RND transporter periplasmic adaptor subunit [Gammaproteobacteria bacterium]